MANRVPGYGDLVDRQAKMQSKYSLEVEQVVRVWMEMVTGQPVMPEIAQDTPLGPDRMQSALRDGVYLCKLMNSIDPGSCRPNTHSNIPFKHMENIGMFLNACEEYGVKKLDMFQTVDLYDNTNFGGVIQTILALGRKCQANNFLGPVLGPKESTPRSREWTNEQLRRGNAIISLQMGTNKHQDSGLDALCRRQIIPHPNSAQ